MNRAKTIAGAKTQARTQNEFNKSKEQVAIKDDETNSLKKEMQLRDREAMEKDAVPVLSIEDAFGELDHEGWKLLMHGDKDTKIPTAQAIRLAEKMTREGQQHVLVLVQAAPVVGAHPPVLRVLLYYLAGEQPAED